jgi:hypothetical protein
MASGLKSGDPLIQFEVLRACAAISYFSKDHVERIMELDGFLGFANSVLKSDNADVIELLFAVLTNACPFLDEMYTKVLVRRRFVEFALNSILSRSVKIQVAVVGFLSAVPSFVLQWIRTKKFILWLRVLEAAPYELKSELLWLFLNVLGVAGTDETEFIFQTSFAESAFDFLESSGDAIVREGILRSFSSLLTSSPSTLAAVFADESRVELLETIVANDDDSDAIESASAILAFLRNDGAS